MHLLTRLLDQTENWKTKKGFEKKDNFVLEAVWVDLGKPSEKRWKEVIDIFSSRFCRFLSDRFPKNILVANNKPRGEVWTEALVKVFKKFEPRFSTSLKKLFFVLNSPKIMADRADVGMNWALSYFQSSVTPMELRLRNFSKVNSSGWGWWWNRNWKKMGGRWKENWKKRSDSTSCRIQEDLIWKDVMQHNFYPYLKAVKRIEWAQWFWKGSCTAAILQLSVILHSEIIQEIW